MEIELIKSPPENSARKTEDYSIVFKFSEYGEDYSVRLNIPSIITADDLSDKLKAIARVIKTRGTY